MDDLPAPLVPAEVDLRGYGYMPFYGHHLLGSEFHARCTDEAWRAGVTLWWAAWNQVPAASLPDDDVALARLADLGRDVKTWVRIKAEALHGFVRCTDGRLYHRFLAKCAIEAWEIRVKARKRKEAWRQARAGQNGDGTGTTGKTERGRNWDNGQDRTGTELGQRAGQNGQDGWDGTDEGKVREGKGSEGTGSEGTEREREARPRAARPDQTRGTRLPSEWTLPAEWAEFARTEQPTWTPEHIASVAAQFRDYWHAKSGANARKADWFATWRNWVRREKSDSRAKPASRTLRDVDYHKGVNPDGSF